MAKHNIMPLQVNIGDLLPDVLREGAQRLLVQAIKPEVD